MPVNKGDYTTEKINKLIQQGYGKGEGEKYKPYIDVIRVASKGRASRVKGWKTNRVHHFLSDSETRFFYLMEYDSSVIDIREHYPLIDNVEKLYSNLDDKLIKRLFNQKSGEPFVLTTSFLITKKAPDGSIQNYARSIKDYRQLEQTQVIERFEVMRRYWELNGIDYGIITNKEIPVTLAKNIEYIHSSFHLEEYGISESNQLLYADYLLKLLRDYQGKPIKEVLSIYDNNMDLEDGMGLLIFKHLLARQVIKINMNRPINIDQLCSTINILDYEEGLDAYIKHTD
ncbi:TnsA endonuclease C-terminal domain-containing protein [Oceanobacillus oncorhynchi]|uniref:TnsA endonuclease C-terminal domain-containing protein n=1 Tax=Oceanobacillus oncorhynchi TaxID=545501 RepID=UPI0034D62AB1